MNTSPHAQPAWPGPARDFMPQLVCIETPGYSGTGYVTLPTEQLVRSRWLGNNILREWILEGAIQMVRAVLASDRHDRGSPGDAALSLTEFEELEFGNPLDTSREIQFVVRIHTRFGGQARGIFAAYQGSVLVAAGKLSVREG
jgi:hypothetical protein